MDYSLTCKGLAGTRQLLGAASLALWDTARFVSGRGGLCSDPVATLGLDAL